MTLKPPKLSIFDKFLIKHGKKRGMIVPKNLKPYDYAIARKESFIKALSRSKDVDLPDGMVNLYEGREKWN
jgi:hypothetical protein